MRPHGHFTGGDISRLRELQHKPERIKKEEVKKLIDEGENPVILDVRDPEDYEHSTTKIKDSVRIPAAHVRSAINQLPKDRPIITY
ncbi:MAG: rhodanese-like domain-containing protein [Candidatus Aquicultor sp.]